MSLDWEGYLRSWQSLELKASRYVVDCSSFSPQILNSSSSSSASLDSWNTNEDLAVSTLQQLEDLLPKLQEAASQNGGVARQQQAKKCALHLSHLRREFQRLQKSVHDVLARRSLLGTAVEEEHVHSGTSSLSQSGYTLLRERSTAHESAQLLSEVRDGANRVRSQLLEQGGTINSTKTTLQSIHGRFPGIDGILDLIRRTKRRDLFVLAGVIAMCILFTLFYLRVL